MRYFLSLMLLLLAFNFTYSSFPVKRNSNNAVVVNEMTSSEKVTADTASMTTSYVAGAAADINWGGFALGLLLGLIGVALAHIFWKDKTLRRSSWYGLGVWIVIVLILSI